MDINKSNDIMTTIKNECKYVIEKEANQQGVKINITPITIVEYYNSDVFKQKTKLQRIKTKFNLRKTGGFFDAQANEIMIFIDRMGKGGKLDSANKFTAILFAVYHEYKHQLQYSNIDISESDKFIIELERFIAAFIPKHYEKNHDKYLMEIDATLYASKKTLKYIKEKHPLKYEEAKRYMEIKWNSQAKYYQINYDFQKTFDKFYKLCRIKRITINYLNIQNLEFFIDNKNNFKPLHKIINSYQNHKIDERILLTILGSKSFISQLNIHKMTEEEKRFMLNILNNIITNEVQRIQQSSKYYEERKIQIKNYLKTFGSILDKIKYIDIETKRLYKYLINKVTDLTAKKYCKKLQQIKSNFS